MTFMYGQMTRTRCSNLRHTCSNPEHVCGARGFCRWLSIFQRRSSAFLLLTAPSADAARVGTPSGRRHVLDGTAVALLAFLQLPVGSVEGFSQAVCDVAFPANGTETFYL